MLFYGFLVSGRPVAPSRIGCPGSTFAFGSVDFCFLIVFSVPGRPVATLFPANSPPLQAPIGACRAPREASLQSRASTLEFGDWSFQSRVSCFEFGVSCLESRASSLEFGAWSSESRVSSLEFRVSNLEFRVSSLEFGVSRFEF